MSLKIPPHFKCVASEISVFLKQQLKSRQFQCILKKINNKTTCLLPQLLSKVTVTYRSFHIKCSMCPPCCWTMNLSQRRHWPVARLNKRCDSLPHSMLQNCRELTSLVNHLWKIPLRQHNRRDLSSSCLEATCQAWATLVTQLVTVVTDECDIWHFTR